MAKGRRSSREISWAVVRSGLITWSMSSFFCSSVRLSVYSGSRMRAMEYFAPSCLAARQHTMFSSSLPVTAMMTSALSTPASISVLTFAPLPRTHMTSSVSLARFSACWLRSSTVMSWPSLDRYWASV